MASKRDQLHAYQFLVQRVVSALVSRESDPEQPAFSRPGNAAFGGIALAIVALAAVGVYGFLNPGGNDAWRDGQSIIVEEETGTRYIYLDERLHPVANYASALLAIGEHAATLSVSRDSLSGVPRGPRIGIPDAPDALPGTGQLLTDPWTLCSQPTPDPSGTAVPISVLMAGQRTDGGQTLADKAVLAEVVETKERYLVVHGYRHLISEPDAVVIGLALRATPAIRVAPAVVEAIPLGRPLAPIPVADMGKPANVLPTKPEIRAGQLFEVSTSNGVQHYLAEVGRLRPITELQYEIQRGYRGTAAAYPGAVPDALPLGPIEANSATQSPKVAAKAGDPPTARPEFASGDDSATLCLTFESGKNVPELTLEPRMPLVDPMSATPRRTNRGAVLADRVLVPAGHAMVVEAVPTEDTPRGTLLVVTDLGVAYPLASTDVLDVLGYGGVEPVRMPAGLVARIPIGPGLSHEAALSR
ncbi:type VII secretion protein EccB [Actinophytocola algeriensis]|uniref:Type VII secretion protein EccB n=1 Tax=Actinophytocola algeriensis TaxID=1768010 RepID=A0A7W7VDQ7_9PSEU|nr:type VII secretion protein EccB [Actinophytocola algeriensis]MBB4906417.1 type VII secretion protein EccB [Actinophytocola algeriensis]MBE1477898.1 type VII secretion protein EccB [Actinophytocola algeriensis]